MAYCCLFMINGLGLGNSTRCYAIMEQVRERGSIGTLCRIARRK
jgi:hypothetical protein